MANDVQMTLITRPLAFDLSFLISLVNVNSNALTHHPHTHKHTERPFILKFIPESSKCQSVVCQTRVSLYHQWDQLNW